MPGAAAHDERVITLHDVLPAVAVGVAQVGFTFLAARHQDAPRDFDAWAGLLLAIGPAALVARRHFPVAVLAIAFAATFTYSVLGYANGPIFFSLIVAYVNAIMLDRRVEAWVSLGLGWVAFLWLRALGPRGAPSIGAMLGLAAWLFVMAAATEAFVQRRRQGIEAMRAQAADAQRQRTEERLRIAREVHDVVAHNISLINVQAGVALHLMEEQPERVGPALAAIKQASRETLDELRSVVDALRGVDEQAPRAPTPGIADVDRLVARTTAAGLPVRLEELGARRALPAGVDLAAYRIVQEALTNALRYARQATTVVRLVWDPDQLRVEVLDDGPGGTAAGGEVGAGRGIVGMRDRAALVGGRLESGPRLGGGYAVRAWLPIDPGLRFEPVPS
jgi:signal transduction histidine kinase